jgi:hypothetical protein
MVRVALLTKLGSPWENSPQVVNDVGRATDSVASGEVRARFSP